LEEVASKPDVGRAGADLVPSRLVGEQESLDLDVGGRATHVEAVGTGDLDAPMVLATTRMGWSAVPWQVTVSDALVV
jgi:hypothetical protein